MKHKTPPLVIVLTGLLFCYGFMLGGQQLLLTLICEQFGIDILGMGLVVAILHIASMLAPAVMGVIADRIGKKKILAIFSVLYGLGCFMAAFSPTTPLFILAMFVIGAGYSVCESLTSAVCVEINAENGARYINLTQCLLSVGAIISPIVMGLLPDFSFDKWRLLYIFCGMLLSGIGILLSQMAFPITETDKKDKKSTQKLWISPVFIVLVVSMFIYVGLENGFGYFAELLFNGKTSNVALGAYGISAYWAGMAFSRFLYSLRSYGAKTVVQFSFLAAASMFVALIIVRAGWICVALCFLVGFSYGPIWTTIMASAAESFPQHKASATGLMSASCGLGGIVYPILMGAIVKSLDIQIGFIILAVSATIGSILSFASKKHIHADK